MFSLPRRPTTNPQIHPLTRTSTLSSQAQTHEWRADRPTVSPVEYAQRARGCRTLSPEDRLASRLRGLVTRPCRRSAAPLARPSNGSWRSKAVRSLRRGWLVERASGARVAGTKPRRCAPRFNGPLRAPPLGRLASGESVCFNGRPRAAICAPPTVLVPGAAQQITALVRQNGA